MRTVIFFQSSFSSVIRRVADGVRRFADRAGWQLHIVLYANATEREDDSLGNLRGPDTLRELLEQRRPDGCIVVWSPVWPDLARSMAGVPCVSIDNPEAAASVCLDHGAIGRAAAAELLRLKPASCAFLSLQRPAYWCAERTAAFAAAMREGGLEAVDLGGAGDSVNVIPKRLIASLAGLPKPCGVFGANDLVAMPRRRPDSPYRTMSPSWAAMTTKPSANALLRRCRASAPTLMKWVLPPADFWRGSWQAEGTLQLATPPSHACG